MRFDKFTTTFQTALADAQSIAVTKSNPYVEPAHLLSAMLAQPDGPKALLSRAGANVARLQTALDAEIAKLPQVQGGEQVIVIEPTGAETELLLQVGTERLTLVMHGRTDAQPDDTVRLHIDPEKAHVFDATTGARLV